VKTNVVCSRIHGFTYSLIACQGAYLATYFPSVYWNTAYLRVVSGLDSEESSNYSKIAKGVCEITSKNIKISPIDINKSGYMFEPDEEHNTIYYSMKALSGLNGEIIEEIINNRPYTSLQDFMGKVKCNKTVMLSLIKSGAFDQFNDRQEIMKEYIWSICEPKKRITMQNFAALVEHNILPQTLSLQIRTFRFNKMFKKNCKKNGRLLVHNNKWKYLDFYEQYFDIDLLTPNEDGILTIAENDWKKQYDRMMLPAKEYITEHNSDLLEKLNNSIFQECWEKNADGNISTWEMESLGYYYHEHELKNVDMINNDLVEYKDLPDEPEVEYTFRRNGKEYSTYKTHRICGTVIAKDDAKSMVSLLTVGSGVVNIKFTRDNYARLNRRISEVQPDGTKKMIDNSWFIKGSLITVNGFKRSGQFVSKTYKKSKHHGCEKITKIYNNGLIDTIYLRSNEGE
jgi:DNA polymerase-3 subunit alpha